MGESRILDQQSVARRRLAPQAPLSPPNCPRARHMYFINERAAAR
jgi:hypothetical protein